MAIVKENFDLVKLLVQHGAKVNAEATGESNNKKHTPIQNLVILSHS